MAERKGSNKSANEQMVDSIWGFWLNPGEIFENVEFQALRNIENQKKWINGTRDQYTQLEDNTKKLATDWKTSAASFLANNNAYAEGDYQEWLNKLEEVGHKSYTIAFLPGKTTLDILSKSTDQLEEATVKAIVQNKKTREEATKVFEGFVEQWKQTQKGMLEFFSPRPSA
ncbi:hypothetical protein D8M04_05135 [Oceanobacillus piezotolerans]|uniref:Polyhydroxyalkanoic acid inclusion protein PhaP n=1 Tax=Oceanobacillus piezotolerans TaxID=2448030 RepID=A0A498D889_9BACI|nr:hypothetical protein [Oceanobacillus piezotolerans]RLL46593.1 hypothetical protein D8M04_05135 [Oceanobacillus piezotolerans]